MKVDLYEHYISLQKLNEDAISRAGVRLFMNTWGNYNTNGANTDVINGGWKNVDEVMPWYEEMIKNDEEPFINDVDDYIGLPFEIDEDNNIPETIKNIQDFLSYNSYDRKVIKSIAFASYVDTYEEVKDIFNKGQYIYFDGVESDAELGQAYIDMYGSYANVLSKNDFDKYIDWDDVKDDWESDVRQEMADEQNLESIDDVDEDELDEKLDDEIEIYKENVKADPDEYWDFLDRFFDFDDFGSSLTYTYVFTDTGAIQILGEGEK